MKLFDKFKKKDSEDLFKRWNDFCVLDESLKNDDKLKPVYYLKVYAKKIYDENIVDFNSSVNKKIREEIVQTIMEKVDNEYRSTIRCIAEYLFKYSGLSNDDLSNDNLIKKINCLDKQMLENIADSHTFSHFYEMKKEISNIKNDDINNIVKPLIKVLQKEKNEYNSSLYKYFKEIEDYIYNLYSIIMNEKFDLYRFKDVNVYFYENGHIIMFNENDLSFDYKKVALYKKAEIEKYFNEDKELFCEYYKEIILNDNVSESIKEKFYDFEHPFTIIESKTYGNIEFYYSRESGIEIKNDAFDDKMFNKIELLTNGENGFVDQSEKKLSVEIIEKAIEMKEMILDKMYDFTLETCNEWDEKTSNGNIITKEYIKDHFSKIDVSILPEYSYIKNGITVKTDSISFSGELLDIDSSVLLGGHEIVFVVQGDTMFGKLNG